MNLMLLHAKEFPVYICLSFNLYNMPGSSGEPLLELPPSAGLDVELRVDVLSCSH